MGDAAGLASLDRACVHIICANLEARDAARLQCVCRALRVTAGEAALWRLLCARDWELRELPAPTLPCAPGQAHSSWAEAYRAWHAAFGAYGSARYRAAKRAVAGIKAWTAANAPAVAASLQPGATEADVDAVAAALELPALAPALRVLWRLLAGQQLRHDDAGGAQFHESALHGVLGSYAVYDHCVSTRLLSLDAVVRHTRACRVAGIIAANSPLLLIAASFDLGSRFFVDALTADVHVALRTRQLHPACPPGGGDGVLRWLERYAADLGAQRYAADEVEPGAPQTRGICLFPRSPPLLSVAITNGVRVESSAVWMPEVSTATRDAFVYRCALAGSTVAFPEQARLTPAACAACPFRCCRWRSSPQRGCRRWRACSCWGGTGSSRMRTAGARRCAAPASSASTHGCSPARRRSATSRRRRCGAPRPRAAAACGAPSRSFTAPSCPARARSLRLRAPPSRSWCPSTCTEPTARGRYAQHAQTVKHARR